jgi:hypothetical protein
MEADISSETLLASRFRRIFTAVTMGTASYPAGCSGKCVSSGTKYGYRGAWFDNHSVRTISLYCSSVNEPNGVQNRFFLHNACRPACSSGVQTKGGNSSGLYRSSRGPGFSKLLAPPKRLFQSAIGFKQWVHPYLSLTPHPLVHVFDLGYVG